MTSLQTLLLDILDTLEGLGYVQTARLDARFWHQFYRKKARRLSLISPGSSNTAKRKTTVNTNKNYDRKARPPNTRPVLRRR
jgi:hypothetical protein